MMLEILKWVAIVWAVVTIVYVVALVNYLLHNRGPIDKYDRLESRDEGGQDG